MELVNEEPQWKTLGEVSEYHLAENRFKTLARGGNADESFRDSNNSKEADFSDVILGICNGMKRHIEVDLIDMLVYADYIQIKIEEISNFYDQLVRIYFGREFDWDFKKMEILTEFPTIQYHFAVALMKSLGMKARVHYDDKILKLDPQNKTYNKEEIQTFTRTGREKYVELIHMGHLDEEGGMFKLCILLDLLKMDALQMRECSFRGKNDPQYCPNLPSKGLIFYGCRCLFEQKYFRSCCLPYLKQHLKVLCIKKTLIDYGTLEMFQNIPLENLHLHHYDTLPDKNAKVSHVDKLLKEGILEKTLQNLIISDFNNRETAYLTCRSGRGKPTFAPICDLKLKTLELSYCGHDTDDFSLLINSPLTKTLRNLTVYFTGKSRNFLEFISTIDLENFYCVIYQDCEFSLDDFLNVEQRKHLQKLTLQIHPEYSFTKKTFQGLQALNLSDLKIIISKGQENFTEIFKLTNFQKTLNSLELSGATVKNDDFETLEKFEKLQYLRLEYDSNVSEKLLADWVEKSGSIDLDFVDVRLNEGHDEEKLKMLENIVASHKKMQLNQGKSKMKMSKQAEKES